MEIERLPLEGALLLAPKVFSDERGSFTELFSSERYAACGIGEIFVQDSRSLSHSNVLRGLHGDPRMAKLVAVLQGSVYDVIVDARRDSATFGRWYGTTLTARHARQVYVPRGFFHGFLALEDDTVFWYKQSAAYDPAMEVAAAWNDPELNVRWPVADSKPPLLSSRDAANPPFRAMDA
jgi:dTDP-4-dehydrorhamnose 3,5-epimerase